MDASPNLFKGQEEINDSEGVLDLGSTFQQIPFNPVGVPPDLSQDNNLDYDSGEIFPEQAPIFLADSGALFESPNPSRSTSFGAQVDCDSQANLSNPAYPPVVQQDSTDSGWSNWTLADPQTTLHFNVPGEAREPRQDHFANQVLSPRSSPVITQLDSGEPGYTNLLGLGHVVHPGFSPQNLPSQMGYIHDPQLSQQEQLSPSDVSDIPLYLSTPQLPTPIHRKSFAAFSRMESRPYPQRRARSEHVTTPGANDQLSFDHERSQAKLNRTCETRGLFLQVPLHGPSPDVTYGSPRSSFEFVESHESPRAKRKRTLTPEGKADAAKVRKLGACDLCRGRKVKCNHVLDKRNVQEGNAPNYEDVDLNNEGNSWQDLQSTPSSLTFDRPSSCSRSLSAQHSPNMGLQQVLPKLEQDYSLPAAMIDSMSLPTEDQFTMYAGQHNIPGELLPKDLSGTPSPRPRMSQPDFEFVTRTTDF